MRPLAIGVVMFAVTLPAQVEQQSSRPGWPCVPGRAVDPAYVELSESTGGQLFLFQKGEVQHSAVVMGASYTHPATVLRAVGHLSGKREFEFPIDSTVESALVMAAVQCRNAIAVSRPSGAELTAANSAQSTDLQSGRILRVDAPEAGTWKIRLTGTGLYVVNVLVKARISLEDVTIRDGSSDPQRQLPPGQVRMGEPQSVQAGIKGPVGDARVQFVDAAGDPIAGAEAAATLREGVLQVSLTPQVERFRVRITGADASGHPFQRTYPKLLRAVQLPK